MSETLEVLHEQCLESEEFSELNTTRYSGESSEGGMSDIGDFEGQERLSTQQMY